MSYPMSHLHRITFTLAFLAIAGCRPVPTANVVTIGMCTDAHLNLMHDGADRLGAFISEMTAAQPDFIIELGDFSPPDEQAAGFFDIWRAFPGPAYHVIGNHEPDGGYTSAEVLGMRNMDRSYYSFDLRGFHFIVLDGNDRKSPDSRPYFRYIGPGQAEWLKKDLQDAVYPTVIFSHQGLYSPEGAEQSGIENEAEIRSILEQHSQLHPSRRVLACFNGHTHFDHATAINGIWYITLTSMAYHWLGEDYLHVRYSEAIDEKFPWIKYTAPFRDPLFAMVEISATGTVRITGRRSEWVGPTPWALGYPETLRPYMRPEISDRELITAF